VLYLQLYQSLKYALSFSDDILILISESTPLLIKIAEKWLIFTNNHSYKHSTANQ